MEQFIIQLVNATDSCALSLLDIILSWGAELEKKI